ncbi:MAG: glycosyltransferase [Microscillaceae bacterium]|nr:glycosyltransferase [Microscillaceae bacterium]
MILVNDCSTDHSKDIILDYQKRDPRIVLIDNAFHQGIAETANQGVQAARGKLIFRMDSDDMMMPQRLATQYTYFQQYPEVTMLSCHTEYINAKGNSIGQIQRIAGFEKPEDSRLALQKPQLVACAHTGFATYKKNLEAVGGYRQVICGEDLDLFTRMLEQENILIILPVVLMKYRLHASSVMAQNMRLLQQTKSWLTDCAVRRRQELPELNYEAYLQTFRAKPWWYRWNYARRQWSDWHYRAMLVHLSDKHYLRAIYAYWWAFVYRPLPMVRRFLPNSCG